MTCLDIKTLGRFDQPGHRATETRTTGCSRGAGWDFVLIAVDDATRLAYVEVLEGERKETTTGFFLRGLRWFHDQSIRAERVMTDMAAPTGPAASEGPSAFPTSATSSQG